jgi:AAA domain-containing protein/DnaB helicase-like protein
VSEQPRPPPPHSSVAERAVIGAVFEDASKLVMPELAALNASDFYEEACAVVWREILACAAANEPIDVVTVGDRLGDAGRARIGHGGKLAELLHACPIVANVAAHARIVAKKARLRSTLDVVRRVEAEIEHGRHDNDVPAYLSSAIRRIEAAAAISAISVEPWYVLEGAAELAAPLAPISWLCKELRLARESVTIVGGYGYSRKTLFAQALCLAIASGTSAIGVFSTTRAAVVHVDYEQGRRTTHGRYQRMARAAGISLRETSLSVATFPRLRLNSPSAREHWRRLLDATRAGLVVIDSLRAAVSDVDENSSEYREHIDLIGQECKRASAAAVIIHHAKKPDQGRGSGGDKYALRGSGAIFDALDEHFMLAGEKGEPTRVKHEKDRLLGNELEDFGLDAIDIVGTDGDPRWGLQLVHLEREQLDQREQARRAASASSPQEGNGGPKSTRRPPRTPRAADPDPYGHIP